MKITINKDQVQDGESYTKEVTITTLVYNTHTLLTTDTREEGDLDIDIIAHYLTDPSVQSLVITYKPEPAETIDGVDIFYSPDIDWESQLDFSIYNSEDSLIDTVRIGYVDNLALLQVLTTMSDAVRIEVTE